MFWPRLKHWNISTKPQNISIRKWCCVVPWEMEFQVSCSHFPLCPMIQLISLFPDESCCITEVLFPNSWWDTHTREMNEDLRLQSTNKFPHHPFSLSRWKHFGFQEIDFKKKASLESKSFFLGKLNWKPVISVNRQFRDSYFVSVGWRDPAVEHYSRFPYGLRAVHYKQEDFQSFLEDPGTPFLWVLKLIFQSCRQHWPFSMHFPPTAAIFFRLCQQQIQMGQCQTMPNNPVW